MPGKNQTYGRDYKTLSIVLPPDEHQKYKIKSATLGVAIADVCRMALADDAMWQRALEMKDKGKND